MATQTSLAPRSDDGAENEHALLSVRAIQKGVARYFGLAVDDLLSTRRARHCAGPRQIAMWLAVELLPRRSLPFIGRAFDRDHTTIIYARKAVDKRCGSVQFREELVRVKAAVLQMGDGSPSMEETAVRMAEDIAVGFRQAILTMAASDPQAFIRNAAAFANNGADNTPFTAGSGPTRHCQQVSVVGSGVEFPVVVALKRGRGR